jgi:DNA-binding NarL/FixJ family response regulator
MADGWTTKDEADQRKRVLVAEDQTIIRLDLRGLLENNGFAVVAEARDGEEAENTAAERCRVDLIEAQVTAKERAALRDPAAERRRTSCALRSIAETSVWPARSSPWPRLM